METPPNTWPDFAVNLYDRLAGRNAQITCEFDKLEIHVPNPPGSETPHSKWFVNGAIKIRTSDNAS